MRPRVTTGTRNTVGSGSGNFIGSSDDEPEDDHGADEQQGCLHPVFAPGHQARCLRVLSVTERGV
jgi:hypothetical protein